MKFYECNFIFYYRPPGGGLLLYMKVLSSYVFVRNYYVYKKENNSQSCCNNISQALMRGCARETRLTPLRRRQPSVWLYEAQLSRDVNIKE